MIRQNTPLIIRQVDNGFMVEDYDIPNNAAHNPMVFQSMMELQQFMLGHFDHRTERIMTDG